MRTALVWRKRRLSLANSWRSPGESAPSCPVEEIGPGWNPCGGVEQGLLESGNGHPADGQQGPGGQQQIGEKELPEQTPLGHWLFLEAVANPSHRFE